MAFCFTRTCVAREMLRFDHKHFAIARWPRRKAPQLLAAPKGNAQGHGANKVGGVPVGFCGVQTPHFCAKSAKKQKKIRPAWSKHSLRSIPPTTPSALSTSDRFFAVMRPDPDLTQTGAKTRWIYRDLFDKTARFSLFSRIF